MLAPLVCGRLQADADVRKINVRASYVVEVVRKDVDGDIADDFADLAIRVSSRFHLGQSVIGNLAALQHQGLRQPQSGVALGVLCVRLAAGQDFVGLQANHFADG